MEFGIGSFEFLFETGDISYEEFMGGFQKELPNASVEEILQAWNAVLADFPAYRLEFLQRTFKKVSLISFKQYRCYSY